MPLKFLACEMGCIQSTVLVSYLPGIQFDSGSLNNAEDGLHQGNVISIDIFCNNIQF